ncbi:hypothetical protein GCM10027578_08770 [Spirosoma luteolum]
MKTRPLFVLLPVLLLLLVASSGCRHDTDAQPDTCRLGSTTDQLIETSGKLTDEVSRTFTYGTAGLSTMTEVSTSQQAQFTVELSGDRATRAVSGTDVIALTYGNATQPTSATFSRGGKSQSTFTMDYNAGGMLTRVAEVRQVLPANSLTIQRTYTFTYDAAGNLVNERDAFTLRDGLTLEQETEFTHDTRPSPYTRFAHRPLLTVMALSLGVETLPARFWQLRAPSAYKAYNLTASGSRANLRESTSYVMTYDGSDRLTSQDQTALLYQSSVPTPVTKKNRQAFRYVCP